MTKKKEVNVAGDGEVKKRKPQPECWVSPLHEWRMYEGAGKVGAAKKRNAEKIQLVIAYIAKFKYSTRNIIADFLELSVEGQAKFFERLEKSSIIYKKVPNFFYNTGELLYALGSWGYTYAKEANPELHYRVKLETISARMFRHKAFIQLIFNKLTNYERLFTEYTPEKVFGKVENEDEYKYKYMSTNDSKIPDLVVDILIHGKPFRVAIEAEIEKKHDKDIYASYAKIYNDIAIGRYDICRYYFIKQSTLDAYKRIYDKERWKHGFQRVPDETGKLVGSYAEEIVVMPEDRYVYELDESYEEYKMPKIAFVLYEPPPECKKYILAPH